MKYVNDIFITYFIGVNMDGNQVLNRRVQKQVQTQDIFADLLRLLHY